MVLMLNFFGRAPDCGPLSVEGRALPPCLTFFLSTWRWWALVSCSNSLVSKTLKVVVAKWQSFALITVVTPSNTSRVWSVYIHSFANPCQLQHVNRSIMMVELCGSGRSPSKTGIEHYTCHSQIRYSSDKRPQGWTYLQKILKIMSCKFLQFRDISGESPDSITSKSRYFLIAVREGVCLH